MIHPNSEPLEPISTRRRGTLTRDTITIAPPPADDAERTPDLPSHMPPLPGSQVHQGRSLDVAHIGTRLHPVSTPPTAVEVASLQRKRRRGEVALAALVLSMAVAIAFFLFSPRDPDAAAASESTTQVRSLQPAAPAQPGADEAARSTDEPRKTVYMPPFPITGKSSDRGASSAMSQNRTERPAAGRGFDYGGAMEAVQQAVIGTTECGPSASGLTAVAVTFAPSGRVTRALIEEGPLKGTAAGSCIARTLRDARIAPFDGDYAQVKTNIVLK